jgi:Predicted double-stranded RNA/RNA-DNA hybrid binding protein
MTKKNKVYVVWVGQNPGIYQHWSDCKTQIEGIENARYKSFNTLDEAKEAFAKDWKSFYKRQNNNGEGSVKPSGDIIVVDAACSGNPGLMEYRGVYLRTGQEIFHQGPFEQGTNNIGEFLAIVHALALQTNKRTRMPIYSDSMNALTWVKKKKCNTKLVQTQANTEIFNLIDRAETWLNAHISDIPLLKWETKLWGEIPADFGRK